MSTDLSPKAIKKLKSQEKNINNIVLALSQAQPSREHPYKAGDIQGSLTEQPSGVNSLQASVGIHTIAEKFMKNKTFRGKDQNLFINAIFQKLSKENLNNEKIKNIKIEFLNEIKKLQNNKISRLTYAKPSFLGWHSLIKAWWNKKEIKQLQKNMAALQPLYASINITIQKNVSASQSIPPSEPLIIRTPPRLPRLPTPSGSDEGDAAPSFHEHPPRQKK